MDRGDSSAQNYESFHHPAVAGWKNKLDIFLVFLLFLVYTLMCFMSKNLSIGHAEDSLAGIPLKGMARAATPYPRPSLRRVVTKPALLIWVSTLATYRKGNNGKIKHWVCRVMKHACKWLSSSCMCSSCMCPASACPPHHA